MTTLELLTIIAEQKKGWNIDGERGILPHLNSAHFILLAQESEQNIFFDEEAGDLPSLDTTDGTYNYTCDENIWKIGGIYIRSKDLSSSSGAIIGLQGFDYGTRRYNRVPIEYINVGGIEFVRVPFVRSWPSTEIADARMVFTENPGNTTDYYKQYGWKKPTQILSESIQIDIPPPWDYQFLLPATCMLLEGIEHGNYADTQQYILNVLKPRLQKEMNGGEQGFDFCAVSRGF
jgi:hypothetical protein